MRDSVDVRCLIPHDSVIVSANVEPANIVSPNYQNIGLLVGHNVPEMIEILGIYKIWAHEIYDYHAPNRRTRFYQNYNSTMYRLK